MAKSNITKESARAVIDRVAQELGLLLTPKGQFLKIEGPTNKQRIYVQQSKMLGRIDTTLDVLGQPGTIQLSTPNGSIRCHIEPTLEYLESFLRMLGDSSVEKQVINKPRPFGATKQPTRTPRPTATPIRMDEIVVEHEPKEYIAEGGTLEQRLQAIKDGVRRAKVRALVENKGISEEEANDILDGKIQEDAATDQAVASGKAEVTELLKETGVEVLS